MTGEIVWRPDPAAAEKTALAGFMREVGCRDFDDLLARSDADPEWYWDAVIRHFAIRFDRPYDRVPDLSAGVAWPKWLVGATMNITASLIDRHVEAGFGDRPALSGDDIRNPEQAKAYVSELRAILVAVGASDAKMEEGSMRVDANVSVRPAGSDELRTRCEVKNINSIRSLGRAIEYEARRHIDLYNSGQAPRQETRHWDEANGRSTSGRSKEDRCSPPSWRLGSTSPA